MVTVKPAQETDGEVINQITEKTKVFNKTEVSCVQELWEEFLTVGLHGDYTFLVAEEDGIICGYVCYGQHALTEGAYDLYWIAVDPAFQNRGVGGALLRRAEEEISLAGGSLLIIETSSTPAYLPAREFYAKHQYTLEATVHDFYSAGDHLVIYTKHLKPLMPQHENHLYQPA